MMEISLFARHMAAQNKLYLPASLVVQWGHLTEFWPMGWKRRAGWQHSLKVAAMGLPFLPPLQLLTGWNMEILAEPPEPWSMNGK